MQSKTLLLALSVAAISSCSTAYKTGQTPDDVYYSPVRVVEEKERQQDDRNQVRYQKREDDYEITMSIRDRRWRDFSDDYSYSYSPYNYATCKTSNYGYYYNPYYYPWAIYTGKLTYQAPVNTTPRMVNLNAYNGYNTRVATGKSSGTVTWANPSTQYNNSNRSSNRSEAREYIVPRNNNSSSPSNDTRTYTPSTNNSSNNSGNSNSGSSSSGSSSGSVSRPGRGG